MARSRRGAAGLQGCRAAGLQGCRAARWRGRACRGRAWAVGRGWHGVGGMVWRGSIVLPVVGMLLEDGRVGCEQELQQAEGRVVSSLMSRVA